MTIQLERVVQHVRRLVAPSEGRCKSDRQLLQEFQARNDQRAFATLVERHGPLVVRVCRHVLGHEHDAQDAFQATFLVLARRVASIRKPESLAAWLHGVAHRIAIQAKRNAARRRAQERQAMTVAASNCSTGKRSSDVAWHEVQAVLDEEIQSLPDKYRIPFVHCVLEGQARAEVARQLALKEGTVWSRLAEARKRLQVRLGRRGIELGAALAAAHLMEGAGHAALTPRFVTTTVQAATALAAGTEAGISAEVSALVREALRSMSAVKVKLGLAFFVLVGVFSAGAGALVPRTPAAIQDQRKESPPSKSPTNTAADPNSEKRQERTDRHGDVLPENALARLGTVRFRQGHGVHITRFSPDGKRLLLGGGGRPLGLWDTSTGMEIRQFPMRLSPCDAVFSPDGKILACGSIGTTLWDVDSGSRLRELEKKQEFAASLAFAPDGATLATGTEAAVNLWNVITGEKVRLLEHRATVRQMTFTSDGETVVSAGEDGTVRAWHAKNGKELRRWQTAAGPFHALAAMPGTRRLAYGGGDGKFRLLDPDSPKEIQLLEPKRDDGQPAWHTPRCTAAAFSADGKVLASGPDDGTIRLWDSAKAKETNHWKTQTFLIHSLAFSRDGKTLISSAHNDSGFESWDVATGKEIPQPHAGHHGFVETLSFAADGKELLSRGANNTVFRWALATAHARNSFRLPRSAAAGSLRTGTRSCRLKGPLWDLAGKLRHSTPWHPGLKDLEARWADLAGPDAAKAYRSIGDLALAGDDAVAFLKTRLAPIPRPDPAVSRRAAQFAADLNSDKFAVRQKASDELEKLGGAAVSVLRKILAERPVLEVRRRVERILDGLAGQEAPFHLRWSRAVEVLEWIATAQARDLMESLAQGDPESRLTREAQSGAERLKRRVTAATSAH